MKTKKTNLKTDKPKSDPPILYTDQATIHASDIGIIIDFGQSVGDTDKPETVIARVGMSRQHAINILKALSENLSQIDLSNLKKHQ